MSKNDSHSLNFLAAFLLTVFISLNIVNLHLFSHMFDGDHVEKCEECKLVLTENSVDVYLPLQDSYEGFLLHNTFFKECSILYVEQYTPVTSYPSDFLNMPPPVI